MISKKLEVVIAEDITETHTAVPVEGDDSKFNEHYEMPKNSPVVEKCIQILNGLCKKYKYAVLTDFDQVSENELEFIIDYTFNGKELGVIRICLDKNTGGKWVCRNYLSVKRAARLPITNLCGFISDFKSLIKNLHIIITDKGADLTGLK
jgi:hypothetical protein